MPLQGSIPMSRSLYMLSERDVGLIVRALSDRAASLDATDRRKAHECRDLAMGFYSGYRKAAVDDGDLRIALAGDMAQTAERELTRDHILQTLRSMRGAREGG